MIHEGSTGWDDGHGSMLGADGGCYLVVWKLDRTPLLCDTLNGERHRQWTDDLSFGKRKPLSFVERVLGGYFLST